MNGPHLALPPYPFCRTYFNLKNIIHSQSNLWNADNLSDKHKTENMVSKIFGKLSVAKVKEHTSKLQLQVQAKKEKRRMSIARKLEKHKECNVAKRMLEDLLHKQNVVQVQLNIATSQKKMYEDQIKETNDEIHQLEEESEALWKTLTIKRQNDQDDST